MLNKKGSLKKFKTEAGKMIFTIFRTSLLFLSLASGFIISCDRYDVVDLNRKIKAETWKRQDVLAFDVNLTDSLRLFNFYINIRNTTDYSFSNLFLFILTHTPDHKLSRDTVECTLADADGKWRGNGFGKIKNNRILVKKAVRFPKAGIYRFEIEQAMRVEELKGIADMGIRIEKQ